VIVFAPQNAAARARSTLGWMNPKRLEARKVDDDAAVAHRASRYVVAAAPDGDRKPAFAREPDRRYHVRDSCRSNDRCRPAVDHSVPDLPRLIVAVSARKMNCAPNYASQFLLLTRVHLRRHSVVSSCAVVGKRGYRET
jgi:hypothetical protein